MNKLKRFMSASFASMLIIVNSHLPVFASQNTHEIEKSIPFESEEFKLNYRDVDVSVDSILTSPNSTSEYSQDKSISLPSSYTTTTLPALRSQSPFGSCWAHSSLALAETSILLHENINMNFSEAHLAYFTYSSANDPLLGISNDDNGSTNSYIDGGGNLVYSMQSLAAWKGAASEDEYPYPKTPDEATTFENTITKNEAFNDIAHLRNAYTINFNTDKDIAKQLIMEYGAIGVSYFEDNSSYSSTYNSYYQNSKTTTNHAIAIVGWDDDFPASNFNKSAPDNGAWLIRNSWIATSETVYSHNGYFWISYYDTSFSSVAYAFDFVSNQSDEFYDNNYQYDGASSSIKPTVANADFYGSNIFTTKHDNEELKAVCVGIASPNSKYTVNIYTDLTELTNPESGTLVSSVSGIAKYDGMHTIKLTDTVLLSKDDIYSVVVKLDAQSSSVGFYFETNSESWFTSSYDIVEGQSYFKIDNGGWTDVATSDSIDNAGNIRIKALTNDTELMEPQYDINDVTLTVDNEDDLVYTGTSINPNITVKFGEKTLYKNKDYTISFTNNINAGNATITLTGIRKFYGTASFTFEIKKAAQSLLATLTNTTFDIGESKTISTSNNVGQLSFSSSNTNVASVNSSGEITAHNKGTASITVKANATGNYNEVFRIIEICVLPTSMENVAITCNSTSLLYNGEARCPQITVKLDDIVLSEGIDYTLSDISNNIDCNEYTVTISGIGNYEGERAVTYNIIPISISNANITYTNNIKYTGSPIEPAVKVTLSGQELRKGTDYSVSYINNVNAGQGTIKITGLGNFKGTITQYFNINKIASELIVTIDKTTIYPGETTPIHIVGYDGTFNYKVDNNSVVSISKDGIITAKAPGKAIVSITANTESGSNYTYEGSININVIPYNISVASIQYTDTFTYNGSAIKPRITIMHNGKTLVNTADYELAFVNNINAGKASITITGKGNYTGTTTKYFTIKKATQNVTINVISSTLEVESTSPINAIYSGKITYKSLNPSVATVDNGLIKAISPGKATIQVVVTKNNYETITKNLDITVTPINLSKAGITYTYDHTYTGKVIKPEVEVTINKNALVNGTDYKISYTNNTNAGVGTITITGLGKYNGTITKDFKINKASQKLSIKYNTNIVNGNKSSISISGNQGALTFSSLNPTIVAVDSKGVITAKKVGTASITVKSNSTTNYGSVTKTIKVKVVPAAPKLTLKNASNGINLSWTKSAGATGYYIYRGNSKLKTISSNSITSYTDTSANTNGNKYSYKIIPYADTGKGKSSATITYYFVKNTTINTLDNGTKRQLTLKWKSNKYASGYQIKLTYKNNSKMYTIKDATVLKKKIKSLTKGTYEVYIRCYKSVGKNKYYSKWSKVKSIKVK